MRDPSLYQQALLSKVVELYNRSDAQKIKNQLQDGYKVKLIEVYEDNYGSFEIYPSNKTETIDRESVILSCIGHEEGDKTSTVALLLHAHKGIISELEIVKDDGKEMKSHVEIDSLRIDPTAASNLD